VSERERERGERYSPGRSWGPLVRISEGLLTESSVTFRHYSPILSLQEQELSTVYLSLLFVVLVSLFCAAPVFSGTPLFTLLAELKSCFCGFFKPLFICKYEIVEVLQCCRGSSLFE
jgi:hypothetical protein